MCHNSIHHIFEKNVKIFYDRIAVQCGNQKITYAELNSKSNQFARILQCQGIKKGDVVAISLVSSIDVFIVMLAVLKLGAVYLPLDISYPIARKKYILHDSGAKLLIAETQSNNSYVVNVLAYNQILKKSCNYPDDNLGVHYSAKDPMYIIYTSGSTGKPKGVEVSSYGVINLLTDIINKLSLNSDTKVLSLTSWSFDISILEIWLPLLCGAIHLRPAKEVIQDIDLLIQFIFDNQPTFLQTTPSRWKLLIGPMLQKNLRIPIVFSGGEPIDAKLIKNLLTIAKIAWNVYGPTETTIWSTFKRMDPQYPMSIGTPFANTSLYILDDLLRPSEKGELYIAGAGLSLGYYHKEDLTKEKFIPHPSPKYPGHDILYKTGDLVERLSNGDIAYIGRLDTQVKFHGYLIEFSEIERLLLTLPYVQSSHVKICEIESQQIMVVYLVCSAKKRCDDAVVIQNIRNFLTEWLPIYMIPSDIILLDTLPLTCNGKLAVDKLPPPSKGKNYKIQSITSIESDIIQAISKICHVDCININRIFFDIGINSLLIGSLCDHLIKVGYKNIELMDFFRYPTVTLLAKKLAGNIENNELLSNISISTSRINKLYNLNQ